MEQKNLGSDMSLTLKLKNPLTEEQLDSLLDVDFDHTNEVYFRTKHGKEVTFVKKQPNNGWISVKDRLPEVGKVVLAFGTRSATTGMFQGVGTRNDTWWWKGHTIKHVSHWMPIPEPPKEEENNA